MELAIDTSVLASFFIREDEFRKHGEAILAKVRSGEYRISTSCLVPVEVCGVIARMIGRKEAKEAQRALRLFERGGAIKFIELSKRKQIRAEDLAINLKLRGADAIILEVAEAGKMPLITFDLEVAKKAAGITKILTHRISDTGSQGMRSSAK